MYAKPGTIVVGLDGSEASQRALHWAAEQAAAEHKPLTLVHAVHAVAPSYADAAVTHTGEARSALIAEARTVLDDALERLSWQEPDLEVHEVLELADPRAVLLQLSESAAMVVVGSRGRGRLRSLLLGSVSVAVVRHARCPVVVVRPSNAGTVRNGVLAGVDATEQSHPVLEFAYRQASLRDLPLTVVHYLWDPFAGTTAAYLSNITAGDVESNKLALSEAMAGMTEKYPDVHVTTRLATGVPEDGLVQLGARMNLIVVGAHQEHIVRRAFQGSVSIDVVEHATCPVAVVPVTIADRPPVR